MCKKSLRYFILIFKYELLLFVLNFFYKISQRLLASVVLRQVFERNAFAELRERIRVS